ncbi:hypothetical protein F4810DRAFT_211537 [Camillea tinctor]|nr:hypothetical protein F4810DRAFT_211537 [Camillea tinctor]
MSVGAGRATSPISSLLALASVFSIPGMAFAAPTDTPPRSKRGAQRRANGENVVLADCKSTDGVASSEIAYYVAIPDSTPDDIAQVNTEEGETEQWANNDISAYFNTTGVTFRATLGSTRHDGDYAGLGNNGYGDFTCWQKTSKNLYSHAGKTCSGVYDCNHQPVPSTAGNSSDGFSTGAIAGITVGVALVALSLVGVAIFYFWRRYRLKKPPTSDVLPQEGPDKSNSKTPESELSTQLMSQPIHELDAPTHPAEVHGDARIELGEVMRFSWLPSPGPPAYNNNGWSPGTPVFAGAYGDQKGTL